MPSALQEMTPGRPLTVAACAPPRRGPCGRGRRRLWLDRDEPTVRGVDGELHIGVQNVQQPLELSVAGRGQERLDHLALPPCCGARRLLGGLYFPAGAAGEHLGRVGGLAENRAYLPVGARRTRRAVRTPVVRPGAAGRDPWGARGRRVTERHEVVRCGGVVERHGELGQPVVGSDFRAGPARPQDVRLIRPTTVVSQPPGLSMVPVPWREAQPRLLDHVLRVGVRSEHAVGDGSEPVAVGLEGIGDRVRAVGVGHVVTPWDCSVVG